LRVADLLRRERDYRGDAPSSMSAPPKATRSFISDETATCHPARRSRAGTGA
jgi:hypothetical protein